jgi:hypothetical protein
MKYAGSLSPNMYARDRASSPLLVKDVGVKPIFDYLIENARDVILLLKNFERSQKFVGSLIKFQFLR